MKYRELGKTGLMVSEIGFGGEWLERHTTEECIELIDYASKNGINIIDCLLSNPKVRTDIGVAIKDSRDKWIIQGHIGSTWQNGQYVRTREINVVKQSFNELLKLLNTNYIDIGIIHFVDSEADLFEILNGPFIEYINELKEKGIIKHIGLSTHNPIIAMKAIELGIIEMIMFSINPAFDLLPPTEDLNVLFQEKYDELLSGMNPERAQLYDMCKKHRVGITVMKPYCGGRLFNKDYSPFKVAMSPIQCINYVLNIPAVTSVMIGYDNTKQIDSALKYYDATSEEKDYARLLTSAPAHSYLGQCTYCSHCKPCPKDIDIAMVNKYYDLALTQSSVPESIKQHYLELSVKASACIECGECEKRCPFKVSIREKMKKASMLFGQ